MAHVYLIFLIFVVVLFEKLYPIVPYLETLPKGDPSTVVPLKCCYPLDTDTHKQTKNCNDYDEDEKGARNV